MLHAAVRYRILQDSRGIPSMATSVVRRKAPLYDTDRQAWLERQAGLARTRNVAALDLDNIAEELEDMGRAERRELRARLETLLMHLLKYELQPAARSGGWRGTIVEQRLRIRDTLTESPRLQGYLKRLFDAGEAYADALERAVAETGLSLGDFPEACAYTLDQALDPAFWPGPAPHLAPAPRRRRR